MRWLIAFILLAMQMPAVAQTKHPAPDPTPDHDIVVVATPDGPFQVTVDTRNLTDTRTETRQATSNARFFAKCVKPFDNESLHELIDGPPNRAVRASALHRIIDGYKACYPGYAAPITMRSDLDGCDARATHIPTLTLCQSFYDRGALVERMIKTYAPNLSFTTAQLFDPPVLGRYHAREDRFNKTRSKGEVIYAQVAGCVVALHPKLAMALLDSNPFSTAEGRYRSTLLGTSPDCVGGAKSVTVDASQFRVYLTDAIYSWAVALRNADSLIPYHRATGAGTGTRAW